MLAHLSSEQFNFIEGCFWILLGLLCLYLYFKVAGKYKRISLFSSATLVTFGISDFMQVLYGSFFQPGMLWLYIWKAVDVIALVLVFVWYLVLRIKR